METKRRRRSEMTDNEIDWLEQRLSSSLSPVTPRTEFVESLQGRLASPVTVVLENPNQSSAMVVIGLGLFFGALVLWLLRRTR